MLFKKIKFYLANQEKCGEIEQAWYDVDGRCLEEIKSGRFVLCKWEY